MSESGSELLVEYTQKADVGTSPFRSYQAKGVVFVREPKEEPYGTVAVFRDLYGDLVGSVAAADA
ncbi:MAG: hypothetical protein ACYDBZ_20505, partial [Steroidobacteraceae bacterium]